MKYTVYNVQSGKIERVVFCPPEYRDQQFDPETQGVVDGVFEDTGCYVEAGATVAMPDKPSEHHVFDFTSKQWFDPRTFDTQWPLVRAERDRRLQVSDWTQLPDVPLATKETWAAYRQALRDITAQSDPFNIAWPESP